MVSDNNATIFSNFEKHYFIWKFVVLADLGGQGTRPPLWTHFFSIFLEFSGKISQIIGWHTPRGSNQTNGPDNISYAKLIVEFWNFNLVSNL